ncbi:MAG: DNA-processing protein DprA [Clostridia bacterium]|nr:DNA-processing protein DprA [Clostridia bacterium]
MLYSESQRYWVWLASVRGLGVRRFDALIAKFGPAQRIWEELSPAMADLITQGVYTELRNARNPDYLDQLFEEMDRCGCVAVSREDSEYPALLRTIEDSPPTLFVRGEARLVDDNAIAIVGARNCTAYGTRMAHKIARDLSIAGVTVVSGLARGIDSVAHRGAIDADARTVAVLGSGVDVVYPNEHRMLADEIIAHGGSIISELKPGTPPRGQHFPARNRIISGMCGGLLLIEAAKRSGTMTTVAFALDQGREVFALPGQADSPLSVTTHAMIRDGARLVTSARDILLDLGWTDEMAEEEALLPTLTRAARDVYMQLLGGQTDIDALIETLGVSAQEMNSLLTIMELQGIIRRLPGRKVERVSG